MPGIGSMLFCVPSKGIYDQMAYNQHDKLEEVVRDIILYSATYCIRLTGLSFSVFGVHK